MDLEQRLQALAKLLESLATRERSNEERTRALEEMAKRLGVAS